MARFDTISTRMKENYEFPYRFKMTRRTPVIIRLDGKAFHSFTKGFVRPFDHVLMTAMQKRIPKITTRQSARLKIGQVMEPSLGSNMSTT